MQYTCTSDNCSRTITLNSCGVMNGSCKFCDPVYRQLTCCADTPNSAGQPFSCSNPPFASVATSKRADLVLYRSRRILTPSCEGGLVAMALMAKARHLMGPTVQ